MRRKVRGIWKRDHQVPESVRNLGRRRVVGFRYMFDHSQRIEEKKIDQAPNLESAANPHPGVSKQPKIVPLNSNRRVVPKLRMQTSVPGAFSLIATHDQTQLTFFGSLSSSAGYHFFAWSAEAGTSRVDFPNCLVVGLADILTLSGV